MEDINQENKSLKGYKIIITIMAVVLVALAFQYFRQVNILKGSEEVLMIQRDTLTNKLTDLLADYDNIKITNDTINQHLSDERLRADSLLKRLKDERSWSYAKVKKYEKELGTLRVVMRGYIRQVDSLNRMNQTLIAENVEYRKEVSTQRTRAESAEEMAQELTGKVRKGAQIKVRDIKLLALSSSDKAVTRASRAARLRIDLVLNANELAVPGQRSVYVRVIGPDGYVLANSSNSLFDYEGEKLTYSAVREVDYENQDLDVSLFYNGSGITGGKYQISIYIDGYLVGSTETLLK